MDYAFNLNLDCGFWHPFLKFGYIQQEAVEKLYEFRDRYFEQHSLEEALQKNQHVEDKLNQTMVLLNGLQGKIF